MSSLRRISAVALLSVSGLALGACSPPPPASDKVQAYYDAHKVLTPNATATPTKAPTKIKVPDNPNLLIVGDSYTAGVGADIPKHSWANVAAATLGYPFKVDGIGGTGFEWGGGSANDLGRQYSVRLKEDAASVTPNLLILQGGQNDSLAQDPSGVEAAVKQTVDTARKLWPGVQVVILGPAAPLPLATDLRGVNSSVRAGAADASVPFIDADEGAWFSKDNSAGFNVDGSHVNTAGHRLIADKFLAAWATIVN